MTKADKVTVASRVSTVLHLRLMGWEFSAIRQYAARQAPPWGVSDRQLWRYIAAGDALLERTLEKDRGKLLNRHLAQRRDLYSRCMADHDFTNARAVLKDEAALLGLYPPTKSEWSGPDGGPIPIAQVEMTDDERTTAVHAILARLGQGNPGQDPERQADTPGLALGAAGTPDDSGGTDSGPLAADVAPLDV